MTNSQKKVVVAKVNKINETLKNKKVVFTEFENDQLQIEVFLPQKLVFQTMHNNTIEVLQELKSNRFLDAISE